MSMGLGLGLGLGQQRPATRAFKQENGGPELLLQTSVTLHSSTVSEGTIIRHLHQPWIEIAEHLKRDPKFLFEFSKHPTRFEEFLAACYDRAGFDEVILTPRSGDRGRDVIATKRGQFSLRVLDQAKAFSEGNLVRHDDIRAMLHVIQHDRAASKGYVTTTSDFAPEILATDGEFAGYMPTRLELRNGKAIAEWIEALASSAKDQ
ncbi:restriction endonuclease [Erythrobacter sp. T5W1-R]|uniref:restriction endonuclease n=1 Tax=Erythrobacter sp. T5W1-R TaxID=3101752 RepID=UPI002AFF4F1E|nr:restriction endonuclease [Erythrobacter sp. T5W1-R]MEA1619435.1 restriction endonuclease [Erythrobacter sp. T5W1-R]